MFFYVWGRTPIKIIFVFKLCRFCILVVLNRLEAARRLAKFVSDIAVFALKRDVKLQPTNQPTNRLDAGEVRWTCLAQFTRTVTLLVAENG